MFCLCVCMFFFGRDPTTFSSEFLRKISTEVVDGEPDELGTCQAQIFGLFLARRHLGKRGCFHKIRGIYLYTPKWMVENHGKPMENPLLIHG